MRQILLIILILLTSTQNVNSQEKLIVGDTSLWYQRNKNLSEKLKLNDYSTKNNEFNFRFWNHGQVIDINKINDSITGVLTNYIFHSNQRTKRDTLFNKIKLDIDRVRAAYHIIMNSGILTLASEKEIESWSQGFDGITYIIEHSDEKSYWFKSYWSPSSQDSIPESIIVMNFIESFSDTLNLLEKYKEFKKGLPHKGCYSSGGMTVTCFINNSVGLGYYGSTKLPIGYSATLGITHIGKLQTNLGFSINHKFNQNHNSDFTLTLQKGYLFFKESNKIQDFVAYQYRFRKLQIPDLRNHYVNHQFYYGLALQKDFDVAIGTDYLLGDNKSIGGILYASKWMSKPKTSILAKTSYFGNHIDFQIGLSKSFNFYEKFFIHSTSIGVYYESFKVHDDLTLALTFNF